MFTSIPTLKGAFVGGGEGVWKSYIIIIFETNCTYDAAVQYIIIM